MPTSSPWPFPDRLRLSWKAGAVLLRISTKLITTKLLRWTQKVQVKNGETLVKAVMDRPNGTPLVTVCNHISYLDDVTRVTLLRALHVPRVVLDLIPLQSLFIERKVKWTPSAVEICFTNKLSCAYFSRCHGVPVVRVARTTRRQIMLFIKSNSDYWSSIGPPGDGVYQRGVDFMISKLNEGHWVHIYPEGKCNNTGKNVRLKWGVGRVIAEARSLPIVLPMWLVGLDDILATTGPPMPNFFKKCTVYVGEPMDISAVLQQYRGTSAVACRKHITDAIQDKMRELRMRAEEFHHSWNCPTRVAYRQL